MRFCPGWPFSFTEEPYAQITQIPQIRNMSEADLCRASFGLVLDLRNRCNLWMSIALQKLFFVFTAADSSFGA